MLKEKMLSKINKNPMEVQRTLENMNRYGKTYLVVENGFHITGRRKTLKGAQTFAKKNLIQWYDDYTQEMTQNYNEIIEVSREELVDYSSDVQAWYKFLVENPNVVNYYTEAKYFFLNYVDGFNPTPEVVEYITEQYNKMLDGFVPEAPAQDEVETVVEEQVEVTPVEESQKDQEAQEIPTEDGIQVVYNEEQNGIELYFQDKPTSETISLLKENKFRWNRTKKCWYKKDSEDARAFVNKLTGQTNNAPEEPSVDTQEVPEPGQYTIRRVDSVTGSEMINQLTIKEFVIEPYAQYKKSLKLKYVNNGERKERAIRFVADKIEFYSGWNSIPTVDGLELKAVFIDGYTGFENNAK